MRRCIAATIVISVWTSRIATIIAWFGIIGVGSRLVLLEKLGHHVLHLHHHLLLTILYILLLMLDVVSHGRDGIQQAEVVGEWWGRVVLGRWKRW